MGKQYKTVTELEVHVELITKTKIFCSCSTRFGGASNTHTRPVCTDTSGSLPVSDKQVVEYAPAMGLVANCQINQYHKFDRENYFCSDNLQNYQIPQLYLPVCHDGWVDMRTESGLKKRARIHGVHMEEDVGKLVHDEWKDCSLVDYGHSEVPPIEIASEPDVCSTEEVVAYLEKLRLIVQYLGVSNCKFRGGSMGADANLLVGEARAAESDARTEIKNLDSSRATARAIKGECRRQIELSEGNRKVIQGTRRWDDNKGGSKAIWSEKDTQDYGYFPGPDLVSVVIGDEWVARVKACQPELRVGKTAGYIEEYDLPKYDARPLTSSKHTAGIFKETTRLNK